MKPFSPFFSALCSMCLLAVIAGCSRHPDGPNLAPPAVVMANVVNSFSNSDAGAGTLASEGVSALRTNDLAGAYEHFQSLQARADLTPEQRSAASDALVSVLEQAKAAAAQGDPQAKAIMKNYMMTK